jgi:precorrin-2 dehydrogenase
MLPITLDLSRLSLMLAGAGAALDRRVRLLDEAGAGAVPIYAESPEPALVERAGARLRPRWPSAEEIERADLVFVAGAPSAVAAEISWAARAAGVLVNVEDDPRVSNFHCPAVMRRGDLVIAVSTGGKSPALAGLLRRRIERAFDEGWQVRLEEIASLREFWRAAGADAQAVDLSTREWVRRRGWLDGLLARLSHSGEPR